mgnify:CR=1 FL=1
MVTMIPGSKERVQQVLETLGESTDLSVLIAAMDQLTVEEEPEDPRDRKRLRILRVATDLFVRHGYRKTSIDDVARAAHVAKGTVYLYFKNKADLLMAAIIDEKVRYARRLEPLLTSVMLPVARLKLWLRIALMMAADVPLLARLLSGDEELLAVLDDAEEELGVRTSEMQLGFLCRLIDEAVAPHSWPPDEVRDRARVLLSVVYMAGHTASDRSRFGLSIDQLATYLADILVDGIGAEAAPPATPPLIPSGGAP